MPRAPTLPSTIARLAGAGWCCDCQAQDFHRDGCPVLRRALEAAAKPRIWDGRK